jgi:HSP20 family protein
VSDDLGNTWMWERARNLIDQAERLQKQFAQRSAQNTSGWAPPVDVFESKSEILILVAIPGVAASEISIGFDGISVTISGNRNLPAPLRRGVIHRLEIPNGRFQRRVPLPVECDAVTRQELKSGCLLISLRKV